MADRSRTPAGDRRRGNPQPINVDPIDRASIRRLEDAQDVIPVFKDGVIIGDGTHNPTGLSSVINTAPPTGPTSLVLSTGANENTVYVDASWTAATDPQVVEYEVEFSKSGGVVRFMR